MAGSRYFTVAGLTSIGLIAIGFVAVAQNSAERPPDGGSREVLVSILIPDRMYVVPCAQSDGQA